MTDPISAMINDVERRARVAGIIDELEARTLISCLRAALGELQQANRDAELLIENIQQTKQTIAKLLDRSSP